MSATGDALPGARAGGLDRDARPWWQSAFGDDYAALYAHRDDAEARQDIAGLSTLLRDLPEGPILDACCGNGRHLACLRQAGYAAIGFDFSPSLLRRARERPGLAGSLVRADLRLPPFQSGFRAILVLFTAFGYFADGENRAVLERLLALLAPGGCLVLDLPDPDRVRERLVPVSQRRLADGRLLSEERRLRDGRVEKEILITAPGQEPVRYRESVRLYDRDDLLPWAQAVGARLRETRTSLSGVPDRGDRLVLVLQAGPTTGPAS